MPKRKLSPRKFTELVGMALWIACNDNPGDAEGVEALAGYLTVCLVADQFEIEPRSVAEMVFNLRKEVV